jgi:hypothetical protein
MNFVAVAFEENNCVMHIPTWCALQKTLAMQQV